MATNNTFQWPLRVYIEDTDAGGIVYYAHFLQFMERARTEYLRSLGFGKRFIFNADLMLVVHTVNIQYHRPARLDDQLIATAQVVAARNTHLTFAQSIVRDGELLCTGEVKIVCVARATMRPKRIPPAMLAVLKV